MKELVRQVCALAIFCALALSLTPEGAVKKALSLCCALVLALPVLTALRGFDYSCYALELARYRELGQGLAEEAEARRERLDRLVVEGECAAWIEQSAAARGAEVQAAVTARWDTGGFWVPEAARLRGRVTEEQRRQLQALIAAELGIDPARQDWGEDADAGAAG